MTVAQYEVLGNDAKRDVRPGRGDRNRPLVSLASSQERKQPSIVPSGTGRFFESHVSRDVKRWRLRFLVAPTQAAPRTLIGLRQNQGPSGIVAATESRLRRSSGRCQDSRSPTRR
jgi:hypothetical protein